MNSYTIKEARERWFAAQSLGRRLHAPVEEAVAATGWIRSLGGATAYMALSARVRGFNVNQLHTAIAEERLLIMPSARGCMYVVPRTHSAWALELARHLTQRRVERDMEKAGMEAGEWDTVADAISQELSKGPRSTNELRKALKANVFRSLGAAGKKVGLSSNLPPSLRMMEFAGRVQRVPVDNRLDHEKYNWKLPSATLHTPPNKTDFRAAVARLFFAWAGPATLDEFAAWSGLNKGDSRAGIEGARLAPCEVEGIGPCFDSPLPVETDEEPSLAWLGAMDGYVSMRSSGAVVSDPAHHNIPVANFGYNSTRSLASVNQPIERLLVWQGQIVGVWAWHPQREEPVFHLFAEVPAFAMERWDEDARRVCSVFAALGHAKAFSMDKEEKIAARAERIVASGAAPDSD